MPTRRISRRTLLAALGGAAITLPLLEITRRDARAAAAPLRYLVLFAGMSGGRANFSKSLLEPSTVGPNYDLTAGLAPLGARDVTDLVSVVTGMEMPRTTSAPGGMVNHWHTGSMGPLLSGKATNLSMPNPTDTSPRPCARTSDEYAAAVLGQGTVFRSLHYRVQADSYGTNPLRGVMSYRDSDGAIEPNDPVVDAGEAYKTLAGAVKPSDPAAARAAAAQLARTKSALDLAIGKQSLLDRLGSDDRQRLARHFDELRQFEKQLEGLSAAPTCTPIDEPDDSTAVADHYANEQLRGPILCDLIRMAFSCDLSRVATLCVTHAQSFLGTKHLIPSATDADCHQTSHSGGLDQAFKEVIAWHVDLFAGLVRSLADTPDVDGSSLLDNTALVYAFEGGHGNDPEEGISPSAHSSENMAMLVAGRAAGNAGGQHIRAVGEHPASVLLTALKNVGVPVAKLGDIAATIAALET